MDTIKIFYDVETTGENPNKHCLHQVAGLIEINGEVVEEFNFRCKPHSKAVIDPEALKVSKTVMKDFDNFPNFETAKIKFCQLLAKYIDKYDKRSKAYLVGFNNRGFDDKFLRMWFLLCDDQFFSSWFWADTLDASVLASEYLLPRRMGMPNFQLHTVAKTLGLEVDNDRLHDARYDAQLTREIYRIVTGREVEL